MLTAAVRDLHRCYPGRFITDVRTEYPELWENNPYLTPLEPDDPEVRVVECHYPMIQSSNLRPVHFVHGFIEYLNEQLELQIRPTLFKGNIHLSDEEKSLPSLIRELSGADAPYWIVVPKFGTRGAHVRCELTGITLVQVAHRCSEHHDIAGRLKTFKDPFPHVEKSKRLD